LVRQLRYFRDDFRSAHVGKLRRQQDCVNILELDILGLPWHEEQERFYEKKTTVRKMGSEKFPVPILLPPYF
jgi:hypothetical protein